MTTVQMLFIFSGQIDAIRQVFISIYSKSGYGTGIEYFLPEF